MLVLVSYGLYFALSLALTIWVGKTLHANGKIFIMDAFEQNESKADAVNNLLLIGFYLVNIGAILLFLAYGAKPTTDIAAVEYLSLKLGVIIMLLGGMHYFNMRNIAKMRSKALPKPVQVAA